MEKQVKIIYMHFEEPHQVDPFFVDGRHCHRTTLEQAQKRNSSTVLIANGKFQTWSRHDDPTVNHSIRLRLWLHR